MCVIVYSKAVNGDTSSSDVWIKKQVTETPKEGLYSVENCSSELSAGVDGG